MLYTKEMTTWADLGDGLAVGQIQRIDVRRHGVHAELSADFPAQLAIRSGNEDFHNQGGWRLSAAKPQAVYAGAPLRYAPATHRRNNPTR